MSRSWSPSQCAGLLAALAVLHAPSPSSATPRWSAHVEGGPGVTDVRPLPSPSTLGGMVWAGVGVPVRPGRATFEFAASSGDDFGIMIPEGPFSGARSLTTFLLGVEAINHESGRGFFAATGAGIGHATLSGATLGSQNFPSPGWKIPDRNLIGFAFGVGVGARTYGGPGPLGLQLALRFHGLVNGGQVAASAAALTVGLAY